MSGVLLWSAPLTLLLNGQTVAVLLMDTQVYKCFNEVIHLHVDSKHEICQIIFANIFQGAFDRQTSMKATSALFSIALLTSSTLILNLDENIQVISSSSPSSSREISR